MFDNFCLEIIIMTETNHTALVPLASESEASVNTSFSAMFNPLPSSTNQQLVKKHHYKRYR